jgi:hypothetical protein
MTAPWLLCGLKQWLELYACLFFFCRFFYLEACESGSIFEGMLPNGINVYATTASNAEESSWGTYCPGEFPEPPPEYDTCLGDLYSVAWMEDRYQNPHLSLFSHHFEIVKSCPRSYLTYSHVRCPFWLTSICSVSTLGTL